MECPTSWNEIRASPQPTIAWLPLPLLGCPCGALTIYLFSKSTGARHEIQWVVFYLAAGVLISKLGISRADTPLLRKYPYKLKRPRSPIGFILTAKYHENRRKSLLAGYSSERTHEALEAAKWIQCREDKAKGLDLKCIVRGKRSRGGQGEDLRRELKS